VCIVHNNALKLSSSHWAQWSMIISRARHWARRARLAAPISATMALVRGAAAPKLATRVRCAPHLKKYAQVPLIRHLSAMQVLCPCIAERCRIRGACAYLHTPLYIAPLSISRLSAEYAQVPLIRYDSAIPCFSRKLQSHVELGGLVHILHKKVHYNCQCSCRSPFYAKYAQVPLIRHGSAI